MDNKDFGIPLKLPDHRATNILSAFISHTSHFLLFIHKTSLRNLKNKQVWGQVWKLQCKYLKIKTEALQSSESAKLKRLLTKALSLLSLSPGPALGAIC